MPRVVITGRGIIAPNGNSVTDYLDGLRNNVSGIGRISWPGETDTFWFAPVRDFEATDWMDAKVADGTDLFAQWALAATEQARIDAGLDDFDSERTGVVHGTSMGGTRSLSEAQRAYERDGAAGVDRKTMIRILPNMAGSQLCMRYGLHGPLLTLTTACASSNDAIGNAARLIRSGEADVALTGGTEAVTLGDGDFAPAWYFAQAQYGMITNSTDERRTLTPFDQSRTGIVIGDGSAMFVIESEEHALARGATILAEIAGYASLADGPHPSAPDPNGTWEALVMRKALANADIEPEQVDALYAHATGTAKGDTAEIRAINTVHGGRDLAVTGIKGHTGHTGAASGAMSAVAALETFASGMFPNAFGTDVVDPDADFQVITQKPAHVDADVIQINSFGFGGQNASLVLRRYS
ncbi:beta-ketoacyl-[acyl-carrier-protein] synthase II [Mycolicibacterium murale]|uniref:Beta-ketoacyl-[acyl-carrier-protein] synthase II n=1 Tax=Mycolicibacterium murale TaxID=182220 RepID=A0A7I9WTG8_9MYCO|nr:beta-ketoacyl-[acyl-carrier-protein] synthase family protein [Mycolicibacterium murale]MCV7181510.1 beta-ketoacyl-[acyl-carrier-protein] synthase family protein [Mycolicibacterium murale]GFG61041.1 beta-ketoacyl-[acyl-carrier-protein] synthase II [Mycolicibacterium murale]